MLKNKIYQCIICKTKPDQLSHHKSHLDTQKHKDKKELFELKLSKLTPIELKQLYNTTDISIIVDENETNTYIPNDYNKKLINNNSHDKNEDKYNKEMTDIEKQKVELSNNISNKEALKDKIHEIHNYLRNNGAGYGMNALKVFNLLYGLKKIEEKKLLDKVKLKRPDCEFSYLLKLANENKDEELGILIRTNVLDSISESKIRKLLFYEIPRTMTGKTLSYLIKEIDKITIIEKTCNVLLSGKIYEYFIGRDESAISELGAYFTDRHIVDYIYKKLDPKINEDGSINTMIDMFGGSGGFTTGYINFLNNKYKNIDWEKNIDKVFHFDMNEDVIKSAGLEFFCLTGILPNMNDNLKYKNSFTDEFDKKKFMNVITNPPYGGDKVVQTDTQIKRKKIKEYIKKELETLKDDLIIITRQRQLKKIEEQDKKEKKDSDKTKVSINTCSQRIIKFAKDNKLTGNDKESASLILIMDLVEENGTAIGVLKEGVFFNKTYKDIRKCLIEKFNVKEIISVPQDQFENTSTKTSIVIFNNTKEKTSKVRFSNLIVERYTEDKFEEINDEIVLTENKDDICGISDILVSEATKDEILKNPICSLNGKDYNKKEIICGKDYELIQLSDISDINIGATPDTKNHNYWENGTIPWVSIAELNNNIIYDTKKHITKEGENTMKNRKIPINSILLSFKLSIGKLGIAGVEMYCNEAIVYLNSKLPNVSNMYLYYIFEGLDIEQYGRGTIGSHGSLNKEILTKLKIPIPKSKQKITEWVNKISKPYDKKNKNKELIMKLEEQIKNKIKKIIEDEDCEEVELGKICEFMPKSKRNASFGQPTGKYNFYTSSDKVQKCDIADYNKELLIIGDGGVANIKIDNIFSCSDHNHIINTKYNKYIYYLINGNMEFLINGFSGSVLKNLSKEYLKNMKLKIPKNKKLIQNLEPLFQQIESLQNEVKKADELYKQYLKELSEEAMPKDKKIISDTDTTQLISCSNNTKEKIIEITEKSKINKNKTKTL
jgi:type I restriction-modification system DNA methylase subunit